MTRTPTLIVGGGLAGLACARVLGSACLLAEAESTVGGLCRTDVVDGFSFDWTGHWLHARDPEMRALVQERWLAGNLLPVERRARIFSEGVWTGFPYQHDLHGLPAQTIADCIEGFVERPRELPLKTAADFVRAHLGVGFEQHFLRPYNEKLFCTPLEGLSPEWGGRFIPRPTLREVLRGALGLAQGGAGYNATFWYPREGGIESLVRALAKDVTAEVRCDAPLRSLDLGRRVARVGDSEIAFNRLALTIPLDSAARFLVDAPAAVREAAAKLRHVSVTTVEVGADDVGGERFHWAYFPEPRFPFYRVGSPSEVNPRLAPAGCRSFAVEFSHRGPADVERFQGEAVRGLAELGLLDTARVRLVRARTIQTAYVLFDHDHAAARKTLLDHFAAHGVELAGRYGLWEYSSMEDALLTGTRAARALQGTTA